jgi:hypothetical protein
MNTTDKFIADRDKLVACLQPIVGDNIQFNKDIIPKSFPCAIVILDTEVGIRFTSTLITWTIYLITNAHEVADPDLAIYVLKDKFREIYQTQFNKDIPSVEYYTSRVDGTRPVLIAKLNVTPQQSLSESKV